MASIAKLVVSLGANTAGFETDMQRASRNQSRRMKEMKRDAEALAKGLAVAFTAAAGAMTAIVRSTTNTADSMAKLGQRLGASTEALSELGFVAEKSGVDFRTLEMGLQRMTRRIGEVAFLGKGEAKQALQILGLEAKALSELPLDKQFEAIAEQLSKVENTSQRTSLAMKIFDAEGVKLVQLMEQGASGIAEMREEMRKTGAVISTDLARNAERFNNNLAMMSQYTKGVGVQLTTGLLPGLIEIQEYFLKNATATDRFASAGEWLADVIKRLIAAFIVMKGIATALGKVLVGVAMAIYNTFKGLFLAVKRPIDQLAQALEQLRKGELKNAAAALGDIPKAMADGFKEGAKAAVEAIEFIGTGMEDVQESIQDAFDLLNFKAEESEEYLSEVIVTARRLPPVFNEAAWALEEVTVTGKRMKNVIVPAVEKSTDAFNAMSTAIDESVRILERTFTTIIDGLLDGSLDAFDAIQDGFKALLSNMIKEAAVRPIVMQFQQAFAPGGGGFGGLDWGVLGTSFGQAAGIAIGSSFGGTGAMYGSVLGSLGSGLAASFAASMAMGMGSSALWSGIATVFAGPLGPVIGAIIGGALGGLFDKERPPVLKIFGNQAGVGTSNSDRDTIFDTAFGRTFLSTRRIDAEGVQEVVDAVTEFDNTIASLLDSDTIAAITRDLEAWGSRMEGNQISMEKILQTRMDVVLANINEEIANFVRAGSGLEDQIDRLGTALSAEKIMDEFASVFTGRTVTEFLDVIGKFRTGTMNMSDALKEVLPLLQQIVNAQFALRQYADIDVLEQFSDMLATQGMTLADTVAYIQGQLGEAIANFDGSPEQLTNIANLAIQARQGELELLAQINSIQQGLNANLDDLEAKIRGLTEGPRTAEDIFREANALIGDLYNAVDPTQIAAIERQFTALINSLDEADQLALQTPLLNMIEGFRTSANAQLDLFRGDATSNADSTQQLVDIFLNDIGDPLDILARSNQDVADELGNIDDSIENLGPTLENAIRQGFRGANVTVIVQSDRRVVNE